MDRPPPRWSLWDTSTNPHGVTHFTLVRRGLPPDGDYEELVRVLRRFGAADVAELAGPYSVHHLLDVAGLRLGIILDAPDELDLYAVEPADAGAMAGFVARLLDVLNDTEPPPAQVPT